MTMEIIMKTPDIRIGAGEFKAKCLRLMEEVRQRRRPVIITKRGQPIAKLVPVDDDPPALYGWLKGTVTIKGDIVEPTGAKWEAEE